MSNKSGFKLVSVGAFAATMFAAGGVASAAELTGAGASFPAPIYAKWARPTRRSPATR